MSTKTILLRAPLLSHSGYGVHARQVARWLYDFSDFNSTDEHELSVNMDIINWGQTSWIVDTQAQSGLIGRIIQDSGANKPFYDVTIQLQLPNEWNSLLGRFNVGMTAGVETDRCNPEWVKAVNRMQLVIVPSEFTKKTFENSGTVTTPIVVIPEAFPDVYLKPEKIVPLDLGPKITSKFNFLLVGQLTGQSPENDRKNIPYTMRWFSEHFAGNPDVGLIIKTSMLRNTHLDRNIVGNIFNRLLQEIAINSSGPESSKGPKFYLLHGDMSESEMAGLYKSPQVNALLSLTHGEGFGLPLLEAAASGLPVIATNWSAHTEFLSRGKFMRVESGLETIHPSRVDEQIFVKDAKWAMPTESESKRRLQKFYTSPEMPKEWAKDLQTKILENYSFESISRQYSETLGKILLSSS